MEYLKVLGTIGLVSLYSSNSFPQITIVAEATNTDTLSTVRQESLIPNPFGPALTVVSANPNQYSFSEFDIRNGVIKLMADDSGNQINGFVAAAANLNQFRIKNITGGPLDMGSGGVEVELHSTHMIDGTPVDTGSGTGEKTAFVRYSVLVQAFIGSTSTGFGITQNTVIAVWNEDGTFKQWQCEPPNTGATNGGWIVETLSCDRTDITVKVSAPQLILNAGESLNIRHGLNIFADSDNNGLNAKVDATSTAQLRLTLPEGFEFTEIDDDLGPLGNLSYVDVFIPPVFEDSFEGTAE